MWVQTVSGLAVDLLAPQLEQICISDIAHSLARLPRFNGHTILTQPIWSGAQHSLLVERIVAMNTGNLHLQLAALLHDAHEAYIGDITTPMVTVVTTLCQGFNPIAIIKSRFDTVIASKFLQKNDFYASEVVDADRLALSIECVAMMADPPRSWGKLPEPPDNWPDYLLGLSYSRAVDAERHFMLRFKELMSMLSFETKPII